MQRDTLKLLEDIRDAGQFLVDDSAPETFESYITNRRFRQSVERGFETIGEAMRRLSIADPDIAAQLPDRPQIISFRNVLAHEYDVIDPSVVWQILQE